MRSVPLFGGAMEARAPNRSYVADRSDLYVLTDPKSIPLETHTPPQGHLILRARRYINSLFTVLVLLLIAPACGMPAPQAFLGAAVSLGVGVAAYHIYQNKAIAHEEEEARKERDKLAQDRRERAEQRRQKEGFEAEQRSYVGYMMAQEKESLLLEDLLHDVYDAVARTCESRPSVNLPLLRLRGSPDSPAEAALGVGLLLGMESHHVERVVKDLSKSCLRWLAAGRLTCKSLVACAEALEAGPVTLGVPKQYLAALDKDSISAFLSLVFHASSSTGPVIHWLKCYTATNVVGIRDLASHLGVLALPWAWFEPARVGPQDEFISFARAGSRIRCTTPTLCKV